MWISTLNMALLGLAALSLSACSTSSERLSGAVTGTTVATDRGVPHRRHWRRYHHYTNY